MPRSRILIPLGGLMVIFLVLSIVFQSSDPGARGTIADISFFGFILVALCCLVIGLMALMRRRQGNR